MVGSSDSLIGSGLGREIDAHTAVFRFNDAPTRAFTADVGGRTTVRIQNAMTCGWCVRASAAPPRLLPPLEKSGSPRPHSLRVGSELHPAVLRPMQLSEPRTAVPWPVPRNHVLRPSMCPSLMPQHCAGTCGGACDAPQA